MCFVLFCIIFKNSGRCGTFEELCKDAFRMAGAVQETSSSDMLGGYGMLRRCFPEKGCILEHQIFRFAKMFLRDRCSTSYDLASLFHGMGNTLNGWRGKIAKRVGTGPSALHSISIFDSELLRFWCCQLRKWKNLTEFRHFGAVTFHFWGSVGFVHYEFWRKSLLCFR